ncbi:MAG: tetratricopeptide repeat protein [Bacteroidales bacterium]|nr:tetratricopeptide repeat protein [Bacteroidales bacterium]MCF8455290.1 tetratricopeptide repeat protein [Bacteroidales bacterium]
MKNSKTTIIKKLLLAFIIYHSAFIISSAQQTNFDSLYAVWQDPVQPDSTRVTAYDEYIWDGYLFSKPDSAAILAEALHSYAKAHNYRKAAALGYSLQGIANHVQGNYPHALEYYEKSLTIYDEIGDKKGIAGRLGNIGLVYGDQSNYPRALEYYEKSVAIDEELGNKQGIAANLNNIGGIYHSQGNYPRALENFEKSLAIQVELGDKNGNAGCLNNIGLIYQSLGQTNHALEYYEKSLAIRKEIGDKQGIASSLMNIGIIYKEQSNYPRAFEYYEKSLAIAEETGDKSNIARSLNNIGDIYKEQGKATLALYYCQKGLALAEDIRVLNLQKSACQCLYDTYKALGKGNEALVYMEKMRVVEDSLNARETTKKLEQMEFAKVMLQDSIAKAEEARLVKEAHQEEVRQKNQTRNVLIGSTLLFILLAGGLYSRWRYVRKSRDIISKEKDRSENLLLNILPAEIAEELKQNGRAEARDFDMVTIIFTDFKGFTEQSAKLSAADLVNEINHCFEAFDGIMEKYGIEKIKTIGDAYMAAGGLPVPTEDSVKNTVLAALEMQAFISTRKATNDAEGLPAFEMRVGIHTGPVVAGIVGVKKFQYDIWGDTVNTASRMESSGAVGKVNISQSTYELLSDDTDFAFESRGKVDAKGKGEMEMWFVSKD